MGAEAISEIQIVELFPQMVRDLSDAGYVYLGGENEGFEAELAFSIAGENLRLVRSQGNGLQGTDPDPGADRKGQTRCTGHEGGGG